MRVCPSCNRPVLDNTKFCPGCGSRVHTGKAGKVEKVVTADMPATPLAVLECPFCNKPIPKDSEYCVYCGNRVVVGKVATADITKTPAAKVEQVVTADIPATSMEMRECPFCNIQIPKDSEFCLYCRNFSRPEEEVEKVVTADVTATPVETVEKVVTADITETPVEKVVTTDITATPVDMKYWWQTEMVLYLLSLASHTKESETKLRVCNYCNKLIPDESTFCMYCGNISKLGDKCEMRDCPYCNRSILCVSEYCVYCGNRVVVEKVVTANMPATPVEKVEKVVTADIPAIPVEKVVTANMPATTVEKVEKVVTADIPAIPVVKVEKVVAADITEIPVHIKHWRLAEMVFISLCLVFLVVGIITILLDSPIWITILCFIGLALHLAMLIYSHRKVTDLKRQLKGQ
jgi:hypothetical protein